MGWLSDYLVTLLQRRPMLVRLMTGLVRKITPTLKLGARYSFLLLKTSRTHSHAMEIAAISRSVNQTATRCCRAHSCWEWTRPGEYIEQRTSLKQIIIALNGDYDAALQAACAAKLRNIENQRSFDLARQFAEPVVVELVQKFYGIDPPDPD